MDDEREQEIDRKRKSKSSHDNDKNGVGHLLNPTDNITTNSHFDFLSPTNDDNNGVDHLLNPGNSTTNDCHVDFLSPINGDNNGVDHLLNPGSSTTNNGHDLLLNHRNNCHGEFLNPTNDANNDENDDLKLTLSLRRPTRPRLHSPPLPSNGLPLPPPQFFPGGQPFPQSDLQLYISRPPAPPPEEGSSPPQTDSPLQLPNSHPMLDPPLYDSLPPTRTTQEYSFFSPPQDQNSTQSLLHPVNNSPPSSPPPQRPLPTTPLPQLRARRNQPQPLQEPPESTSERIDPIRRYPWATSYSCTVHTLDYLLSNQIHTISGEVQCKRCDKKFVIHYDLLEKFTEISRYIARNKYTLHDRAPSNWTHPILPACRFCELDNSAKPVISDSKKYINWLFLLLGQMIGCCTLEQLKYFCKHTRNHRTGAKDRVLFLTYLELCKQLDPTGPFERL